ncbi:MAG: autotransporter outer membrane beta-barrel domain-containing protein, partial [Hyphomicrobium sp.]
ARVGRQTRNTGGVLGRFDGGLVSWQATPWLRWNVVGGSPVASRRDDPFKDEKFFYGTSIDFGPFLGGFDFSLFTIAQQAQGLIDRAAIGAELRYRDAHKSAFATVDYDVHFQEFNAAIFSGTWTFADKSTLHGGADYRKSPYLTSWNALQGQQFLTLFDLLKLRTRHEVDQMALDRTTAYTSATIGYSRPLTDKLQVNVDATTAHIDGTIASFGVDAAPSTGNELYLSGQLIGSNIFAPEDLFIFGTRFADRQDSNTYAVDFSMRFPLTPDWRINPRLMLSYRDGKTFDFAEHCRLSAGIEPLSGPSPAGSNHWPATAHALCRKTGPREWRSTLPLTDEERARHRTLSKDRRRHALDHIDRNNLGCSGACRSTGPAMAAGSTCREGRWNANLSHSAGRD